MQNRLLKIAMYSIALNILFVPFNSSVAAIFGYCTILISVLYPLLRSYEAGKLKVNTLIILLAAVLLASALTSIADFQRKNLQNYIVSAVSFLSFYWALSCSEQGVGGAWLEDLYKANYILCAIFIAFSFGPFDFKYMQINQWGDTVFSMGLGNPNTVAVHVMFSLILLIMKNLSERKTLRKAINWCLILLLLVILYKLSSRTVMAATVTVLICVLLRVKKRNSLWIAYIALLVPLLIVIIQPMLSSETLGQVLGKSLETGRGSIFRFFFKTVRKNPHHYVVGRFFKYGFENYHNVPPAVLPYLPDSKEILDA